ncbi:MAG: VWA domain-containing protein [bacterium]|nr:VWA domain-containing protein [bacterium]
MKKNFEIASYLLLALICALPAAAQTSTVDTSPTFGEIIDVRVINLEVVVTDGKTRVHGLGSEDFRLLVNGEEVLIEYFTEVVGGTAVAGEAAADGAIPALAPGEAVGTRFLVFIDDSFSLRSHRNRVLRRLAEQLPNMAPEDHMAIVAFDGRQIELLSSWTSSQRELARVLQQARERRSSGLHQRSRTLATTAGYYGTSRFGGASRFGDPFGGSFGDPFYGADPFYGGGGGFYGYGAPRGSQAYDAAERVLDAATSTLRAFARPPGRKVMLLLSGGWPIGDTGNFTRRVGYGGGASGRSLLRPLTDTANRLGYTLYPVDVKGVESRLGGAQFATTGQANYWANLGREQEFVEEGGLLYLAKETGGRALLDGASLTALQRAVEDTRTYYWIGFTPTWEGNDRRHRVKVEVRQRGLKVRSRKSFSDLSRQTEVSMLVESGQLFDLPLPGEDQELNVTFGEPQKSGYRKVIVPLQLEIPLDQVTLLPTADGYVAELELRVAVTDDRGNRADIPVIPVALRRETGATDDVAHFEFGIKLRKRPHQMVLSLHEPASGNLISKRLALEL